MFSLINYPPTEEQIWLLMKVGIGGETGLLWLRSLTLLVFIASLFLWYSKLKTILPSLNSGIAILLLIISPALWVLCWSYPLLVFKLVVVITFVSLAKTKWWLVLLVLMGIGFYNIAFLKQNPAILSKVAMVDAKNEVNSRFMSEDTLRIKMELPLTWRRIGYNKYFITYRQILAEMIPFFDLETLYFQEVHPMEQKSVVLFYWPEIFLLIFGIYFWITSKNINEIKKLWSILMLVAFVDFLFSNTVAYQRFILLLIPLSLVMSMGLFKIMANNRSLGVVLGMVLLYSTYVNGYDITKRADYWLDNRPLVYQYWYKGINEVGADNFNKIQVSTLVGNSQNYCWFYLGEVCKTDRFLFNSFDLTKDNIDSGLYVGFTGEFVGSRFKNDFPTNWELDLPTKGLRLVSKTNIRDTVAYKYGNDIGLVIKQ